MILGHDLFSPHIDSRVIKEARSIYSENHDVMIVCWSKRQSELPESLVYEGIEVRRIFQNVPSRDSWIGSKWPSYKKLREKILKLAIKYRPDIVYCHDLETLPFGSVIKKRTGSRLIYDSHEDWPAMESMYSRTWGMFTSILEKHLLRRVDMVVTVNDILREKFSKHNVPTIVVMNCATEEWAQKRGIKKFQPPDENQIRVAYWGGVAWRKGMRLMIDIADILKDQSSNILFDVIGEGPDLKEIIKIIDDRKLDQIINLRGTIDHESLPEILAGVELCYSLHFPTRAYVISTPIKLLEGLALGIPFIGNSEFPSVAKIAREFNCGILSHYDAKEAANIILKLSNEEDRMEILGENALVAFKMKYNWESQARNLIAALDGFAGKSIN